MSKPWRARLDGALREGEVSGLYFTTALLIVVEFCFVCWLNRVPIPDVPNAGSGFIVLPPWYQKPRFEVTMSDPEDAHFPLSQVFRQPRHNPIA